MAYRKTNIRQRITSIILAAAMLGTSPGHAFAESEDSFAVPESTESGMLSASSDSMTEAYLPTFEDVSDASGSDASDIQEASALPAEEAASPQNTTSEPAGSTDYSGSGEEGQTVSVSDTGAQADPVLPADDSGAAALPGMEEDTVQDEADPIEYEDEEVLVEKTLELQMTPLRLYEHDDVPTSELDTANQLWQWLYGRDPKPDPNPSPAAINVKIKGNLPEDVTAQAGYILFDDKKDEEGNDYPETAIASVNVSFVRSDGSEYIPVSDLKVTVSGQAVEEVISGADPYFLVYAHDEYNAMEALIVDESTFTSDVTVFRELPENDLDAQNEYWSKHADRLAYVTNQTHEPVTFIEDAEGLKLKKKKKKITFTFNEGTPLRFIVSAQTPEADIAVEDIPVEVEDDETEGLPVVEIPETEGIPVSETENVIIQETETTAVQETEALPAEIEELPVVEKEETEAAAVQETEAVIIEETEAAPVPETEIQTEFVEETETEQIEIPAASETESEIQPVDETESEEETETENQAVVETETEPAEWKEAVEETEPIEDELINRSLKVRSDDGSTLVSVSGLLPKDVTADATSEDAEAYSAGLDGEGLLALDITLSRGEGYVSDTDASAEMSGDDAAAEADAEAADRTDSYQTDASQDDISDADVSEDVNGFAESVSYQPEEPVRVVLTDPAIGEAVKNDSELEVWHIADDGTSTKVEDVRFVGNSAVFYADGFSVYVVVSTTIRQTLTASDGNEYSVTVTYDNMSGIPSDAELVVTELKEGDEGYAEYVAAAAEKIGENPDHLAFARPFDITLKNPETDKEYQPNKNVAVTIELLKDDLNSYASVDVIHIPDGAGREAEVMDSTVHGESVEFETDGFSVYVLTASTHLGTYYFYSYNSFGDYQGYNFYDDLGNLVTSQTIKNGETLVAPHDSPTNPNNPSAEFKGWYLGTGDSTNPELEDKPFDFDKKQNIANDETFYLYAVFAKIAHVTFHSQYDNNSQTDPVLESMPVELVNETVSVDISNVTTAYYSTSESDHYEFYGWSTTPFHTPGQGTDEIITNLEAYPVSRDIDLYPVFRQVHYLTLTAGYSGTSATYYSPVAVPVGGQLMQSDIKTKYIPTRPGYTFKGWYLAVENAETVNQNGTGTQVTEADGTLAAVATSEIQTTTGENGYLLLSTDVTLYAKWEAADVDYTIVAWKQRKTDEAGLENENKTWDFAESFVLQAKPYTSVTVDEAYKALNNNDNYNSVHDSEHQIGEGGTNPYTGYSLNTGTIGSGDNTRDLSDTTAQSIAYEGTTVFNLYYDWKGAAVVASDAPHTLKFMNGDEEYSRDETVTAGTKLSTKYPGTNPEERPGYEFHWYLDSACTKQADGTTMPDHDLILYAGWEKEWYLIQIDPNFGELAQYDNAGNLIGNGSTYFWKTYQSDYIQEYTWVTRDYVESDSGNYYFVQHDNNYNSTHSNVPNRWTYYTTKIGEATSLKTYKKSSGTYLYDGWYQVNADGTETPYTFGELITGNTTLRLHWKKAATYYLQYNTDVTIDGQRLIGTLSDDSVRPDSDGYRDEAEIIVGGRAVAPEGYAFVGWTIRGDDSGTVYYPGKTFSLQGEYAVTVNGKKTVYLDAVYQQIKTARIVYDANGGTISNSADSGYPYELNSRMEPVLDEDLNLKNLNTHKVARDTNTGTVTVSGLVNNSPVKLSSGEGFTAPENSNATLTGWNTEPDGSGDHYALGAYQDESGYPICVDINDPVTLYAEWLIKVYFNKNDADAAFSDSGWTDYTPVTDSESPHNGEYYMETYVNATLKEPTGTVTKTGASFDFWSKTADGDQSNAFQFDDEKLTGECTLYAHLTEAIKVPYHVVSSNKENWDSWRKTDTLRVTSAGLDLSATADLSSYVTAETGYTYSYACLSDSAANISEDNKITAVKLVEESGSQVIKVTPENGIEIALGNDGKDEQGRQIYLVYTTDNADNRVKLAYVQEGNGGALNTIVGAVDGKITYNGEEFNSLNTSLVATALSSATVANGSIEGNVVTGQVLTLSGDSLEISQRFFPGVFNAPPLLDNGTELLSLVYDSFGVSNGDGAAANVSTLVGAGKKLYLRYYDGKRQWSQDETTWTTFTGDTLYVVYHPRGLELEITKAVTGDNTGISPEESFAVTVTSDAIIRSSYPVEGTGYNTVAATPASGGTPGSIELTVKDGSDIKISGLGSGSYTVTETHNANYTLNAKIDNEDPVTADTVTVTLDQDRAVHLSNGPHEICQIMDIAHGGYKKFFTLNKALEYAGSYMDGEATIQMLSDYVMPDWDVLEIPAGYAITLTKSGTETKTITRNPELATTTAMLTNNGTLMLEDIILDGTGVSAKSSMVRNAGTLTIGSGAQFKNANRTSGNGGAVFQTQGTMTVASGASFTGNSAANGGAIFANSGIVTITGGTFTGNTAGSGNGGAIYYAGRDTVTISGGTFTDNTSTSNGGAIYASGGSLTVSGSGTSISSNTAGGSGGAIYSDSGTVSIYGGTVGSNTAAQDGGAVYSGSGAVEVSGGTISGSTATNGNGGAICSEAGTVTITGGAITGSRAEAGFGGAVYVGSGTVEMTNGTIGGTGAGAANSAKNGGGIYVNTGSATLSAGSITNNAVKLNRHEGDPLRGSALGGAVGVGSNSARLYLSGNMQITGNKAEVNTKDGNGNLTADVTMVDCNVYLDRDADDVINISGLISANIGIYVSDSVYSQRGVPGAKFATYTTDTNKNTIKNDRDTGFSVVSETAAKKLYWGNGITVVVRYQKTSFATQLPPEWTKTGNDYKSVTITNYYPVMGDDGYVAISALAENLYTTRSTELNPLGLSTSAAYGGAWLSDSTSFNGYVTKLTWDTAGKKWMLANHNGEATEELGNKQLIVYYTEPAYISIENNMDMSLTISALTLSVNGTDMSVINTPTVAGYGMLFAKNGAIRTGLFPVESSDLVLESNKAVSLLIPGGRNMSYSLAGSFNTTTGGTVNLRTTKSTGSGYDSTELSVDSSGAFTFPTGKNTLNQAGTYQIIFGDDKMICKINTAEIANVSSADYLICTDRDSEGNVEYVFKSLKQAIAFVKKYMSTTKTATIEMLTDYLLPASDNMAIEANYNITVTTASSGTYQYTPAVAGENRATISRDSENKDPLIAVTSGNNNTFLTIENLIIDGKSVQGSTKDGAVSVKNAGLTVRSSAFKNVYAGNGGAIFAECDQNQSNSWIKVYNSTFSNCHSTKTGSRDGGGAIHAYVNYMDVDGCKFDSCDADWQAGGIFHKVENNNKYTESYVKNCTFTNCRSKAAGGMELGSRNIIVMDCTFTNCVATERNGGGFNVYALKSGEPTADCWTTVIGCTFTDCHNTGSDGGRGGGFRCTSKYTTIINTGFTNTSAIIGGAVALSSKNAERAEIYGGTIDGGVATNQGGGVYCIAKTMKIGGSYTYKTDGNGKPIIYKDNARIDGKSDATTEMTVNYATTIKNCSSKNAGGGIYHENNTDKYEVTVTNTTIQNCTSTDGAGGGICTNSRTVTVTGSKIQNNRAKGNGGGICTNYESASYRLTVDSTEISGNVSGGMGGGIYNKSQLTLRNGTRITGNRLTGNTAENAAGVYVLNSRTLTVGTADATDPDGTTVKDNTTAGGTASDVRLAPNGSNNATNSVSVLCDLSGEIRVVNPGAAGTQFGTRANDSIAGFTEGKHVFISDSGKLYGVYNRNDVTRLIWRGGAVCKLTDATGHLLYLDEECTDPAVFDRLDYRTDGSKLSPFSYFRQENNSVLLYRKGESAALNLEEEDIQIKMLVSDFDTDTYLTMKKSDANHSGWNITLTTARSTDADDYPYTGRAGSYATIKRTSFTNSLIVTDANLTLRNITLDGGSADKTSPKTCTSNGGLIYNETNGTTVTLSANSVLQNCSITNSNSGAAVYIKNGASLTINGGAIYNCSTASGNGGGVYKTGAGSLNFTSGNISKCSAVNGGGIYFDNGSFDISGSAQITGCTASSYGGGVYLYQKKTLNMSGGSITGNHAGTAGGGIYLVYDNATRLNLSGRVTVSGNTCGDSDYDCNVQLGTETNNPATGTNGVNVWNGIINSNGITRNSYIGIYVPGTESTGENPVDKDTTVFDRHGIKTKPFGTYSGDTNYLYCFVNDRNGLKGGLQIGDTHNYIYWVEIFSLTVGKTVISGDAADLSEEFRFNVTFSLSEGGPAYYDFNSSDANNCYFTYDGAYAGKTDTDGNPNTISIVHGAATVYLKNGESITVDNLPAEINNGHVYYRVEEVLTDSRKEHYTTTTARSTNPSAPGILYVSGTIGENLDREDVSSKYVSNALFDNLNAICKLTSSKNGGVLLNTLDTASGNFVPAVYTTLCDSSNGGAFDVVNASKPLYFWNSFTMKYEQYNYSGNDTLNVEMLVEEHTPLKAVTLNNNKAVTFTTASSNAKDGYPYVGTGSTAHIIRGTALGTGNYMFTANGALTLNNICLDGNNLSVNNGLVTVSGTGSLTVETDATLRNTKVTNPKATNGGAVFVNGGTMTMTGGTIIDNSTMGYGGGAIRMTGNNAKVTISGGEITGNEVQNNDANGGAISVRGGRLIIDGGTIKNNTVSGNNAQAGGTNKAVGGAIYVHSTASATISGGTIQGNTVIESSKAYGGAVYIEGTLTLSGGTINGNTAAGSGAGIYLMQGSKLNLSGNPNFGGTAMTEGNRVTPPLPAGAKNGGEDYTYARQDIYLEGYAGQDGDTSAASLTVDGDITSGKGTIWVWAEQSPHYKALCQFAKYTSVVTDTATTLAAFRNAQDDAITGADQVGEYLYGITKNGDTGSNVYWYGLSGYNIKLKKTNGFGNALKDAVFTLYSDSECATALEVSSTVVTGTSDNNGVVIFNNRIPIGVYYMKETTIPNGYANTNTYIVLVGDKALAKEDLDTTATGYLTDISPETITGQTALYKIAYQDTESDYDKYAVFLIDSTANKAVATPDIARYGIMNISTAQRKAILRKVEENTYKPLPGAVFEILRYDRTKVSSTDINGAMTTSFTSGDSGVYFIDKLPFGTYYLHETKNASGQTVDLWFILTVNENGVGYERETDTGDTLIGNTLNPETTRPN